MSPWLLASLAVTLVATATLALWPADPSTDLLPTARSAGAVRTAAPQRAAPQAPTPASLPTRPADWPAPPAAALAAWQGAAPPPPAPLAADAPGALAARAPRAVFPYRWIGRLDDGDTPQVLLASPQRTVAVRLGAVLDGRWRLQATPDGVLQAQPLPDGEPLAVPGAPLAPAP